MNALPLLAVLAAVVLAAISLSLLSGLSSKKDAEEGARSSARIVPVHRMQDSLLFLDESRLSADAGGAGVQAFSGNDLGATGEARRGFAFDPTAGDVRIRLLEPGYADRLGLRLRLGDLEELVIRSTDQMEGAARDAASLDLRASLPSGVWVTVVELSNGVILRGVAPRRARRAAGAVLPTAASDILEGGTYTGDLTASIRRAGLPAATSYASARDGSVEWRGAAPHPEYDDGSSERLLWSVQVPSSLASELGEAASGPARHTLQTLLRHAALRGASVERIDLEMRQTEMMAKIYRARDARGLSAEMSGNLEGGEGFDMMILFFGLNLAASLLNGQPATWEGADIRFRDGDALRFLHVEPRQTLGDADITPDVSGLSLQLSGGSVRLVGELGLSASAAVRAFLHDSDMHGFALSAEVHFQGEDELRHKAFVDDVDFGADGGATATFADDGDAITDPRSAGSEPGTHSRVISAGFQIVRLQRAEPDSEADAIHAVQQRDVVWSSGEINFTRSYVVPEPEPEPEPSA